MMREIENPMVLDSLWDELDQVDQQEEPDPDILADMMYEDEIEDLMRHGWGHVNGYYL